MMANYIVELISRDVTSTLLVFLLTFLVAYYTYKWLTRPNIPPGYPKLPIVGSIPFLWRFRLDHIMFQKLAEKFGPVFRYYIGNK